MLCESNVIKIVVDVVQKHSITISDLYSLLVILLLLHSTVLQSPKKCNLGSCTDLKVRLLVPMLIPTFAIFYYYFF